MFLIQRYVTIIISHGKKINKLIRYRYPLFIVYIKKISKSDIWGSPSVTHKITNQTLSRLTSEFGRDPVRST